MKHGASYQVAKTILFYAVQDGDHITPSTGRTWTAKITKGGAAPVAYSSGISEIHASDMPGWYAASFAAGDFSVVGELGFTATASGADRVNFTVNVESRQEFKVGMVDDAAPTSSSFITDLGVAQSDFCVGSRVVFITGPRAGESKAVQNYDGSNEKLYVASFVGAPNNGDFFLLANGN